ncbi:MAG: hypothetical protein K2P80_10065 [Beijerinckiaceae bacterium]|nr:hypothetical protein [Beijerinckiaceae bacterium]
MATASPVAAQRLSGQQLTGFIAGKRVYLKVPLGGEMPLYYAASGKVDGSGEAVGLGRFLKPSDSGRWWVDGDRLCQKWSTWYDGKPFCFTIDRTGDSTIAWVREDGYAGTARVGE